MSKVKRGSKVILYPVPIVLLGANVDEKPNYSLIGNVGIMCLQPATIYVSSHRSHHTNKGIHQNKTYSVNIPAVGQEIESDYCGIVHGFNKDKSEVFESFYGDLKTAPMAKECPVNLECQVIKEFSIGKMEIFIGEIIESHIDEELVKTGKLDITKVNPLIYSLEGKYYQIGDFIAEAFSIGKKYKNKK